LFGLRGEKLMGGSMMQKSTFNGTVLSHSIIKLWWTKQNVSVPSVNESLNLGLCIPGLWHSVCYTGVLFEKPLYRVSMECSTYYRPNPPPYAGPSHRWGCGWLEFLWNLEHTAFVTDHITINNLHA